MSDANFNITDIPAISTTDLTDFTSWTPTGTWVDNTTYSGFYKLVGDLMVANFKILTTGNPTSTHLIIDMPTGFIIDVTKITSDLFTHAGNLVIYDDDTTGKYSGDLIIASTSTLSAYAFNASGTYLTHSTITQAIPITFVADDYIVGQFIVPWTVAP